MRPVHLEIGRDGWRAWQWNLYLEVQLPDLHLRPRIDQFTWIWKWIVNFGNKFGNEFGNGWMSDAGQLNWSDKSQHSAMNLAMDECLMLGSWIDLTKVNKLTWNLCWWKLNLQQISPTKWIDLLSLGHHPSIHPKSTILWRPSMMNLGPVYMRSRSVVEHCWIRSPWMSDHQRAC